MNVRLPICFIPSAMVLVVFLFSPSRTSAQLNWERAHSGIWGAAVYDIVFTPAGMPLVSTRYGLYRYEADPDDEFGFYEWKRLDKRFWNADLEVSRDGRMFAGIDSTMYEGFYFSDDSGTTWIRSSSKVPPYGDYTALDSTTLISLAGISTDAGKTWQRKQFPVSNVSRMDHDSHWNLFGYTTNVYSPDNYLYWSTDTGRSWTYVQIPLRLIQLEAAGNGEVIGITPDGIYHSADTGRTWNIADTVAVDQLVQASDGSWYAQRYLAPVEGGRRPALFRSVDNGRTWEPVSNHSSRTLAASPNGSLWSIKRNTVYCSFDGGAVWTERAVGLAHPAVDKLLYDRRSSILYAQVQREFWLKNPIYPEDYSEISAVFLSTDEGESWRIMDDSTGGLLGLDSVGGVYIARDSLYEEFYIIPADTTITEDTTFYKEADTVYYTKKKNTLSFCRSWKYMGPYP